MATYSKQTINDGFLRGTEAGAQVQIGTKAKLQVKMQIEAKTVSDVYKELSKYKRDYSASSWEKIEKAHTQASAGFFYELLGISAGGSYDYSGKQTKQDIKDNVESQRTAQALHDTDNTTITITGDIEAVGQSYVPVQAFAFVHLTQVSLNEKVSFNAVANQPDGKAADKDGSQKDVSGTGKLNVLGGGEAASFKSAGAVLDGSKMDFIVGK